MQAIVGLWGKSLAVRLPADLADAARLSSGSRVEMEIRDGSIVLHPVRETIEDLFIGCDPVDVRGSYADAFEWGADRGREQVE